MHVKLFYFVNQYYILLITRKFVIISKIIIILEYILGYLFDKNHEGYYDIYMAYTNNNYCSTHLYVYLKENILLFIKIV
ncbi:LOW QUALITY PROTEIN: hypothetical protein PFMC_02244 [Plasmodium falciparum CAMP/Malaysia]|uniref:Uncharacterized protein n=1 Tax=Plasmodium falciparum (isolate Camp / Malaysia) TaxID=5835 RepID=A0A024XAA4_PLAFC|nr:LOW QUALITY PROTEIN: hypothetical protein PFMC_02244 [Plasmodium falciparum CAMP/Malaysia]